ncbi:MAG: [citrate (pro-3S)-lyase] ligase [Spirochaetaceae bacterium 4572_59]|nr:MAG: [citrate (pro-3S)-lyase] ligase [Spirochaetaceae bacterium 4572_59]
MSAEQYEIRTINLRRASERNQLKTFLLQENLTLESDLDYAICLMDGDRIIGSGCASGNVLKCIAVDVDYQGQALTNRIISYLRLRGFHEGYSSLFLFTKPGNETVFSELGFFTLAKSPDAILMENRSDGFQIYIDSLKIPDDSMPAASIVMNCNPFTLGHRYLIEKACGENERVHLFVVKEDLSVFPFDQRMSLIQEGCSDLKNLFIHEGRDYIISHATFPTYFIKDSKIINDSYARIDLDLFARRIAPALSITKRYVGEEPFDVVTSRYNQLMKEILPENGVDVVEIPRKSCSDGAVSATKVRKAMADNRYGELKNWVPPTTYDFLLSEEGQKIGEIIKRKALSVAKESEQV